MEKPTDINGQLLCLGAGQEHAEIKRVKKTRLADPASFLNQLALHDGDLPAGPPKLINPSLSQKRKASAKDGCEIAGIFAG